jgi:predicted acylesterase/phospholipase RssA
MASFRLGINMAGAISAGAYTAGVLDFLTEALDEWYDARARGEAVPRHDVSIEVFSGASAGGMCAAISAVMLQEDFTHIDDTTKRGTDNRFYESWVNRIDITELLKSDDLKKSKGIISFLDSSIVEEIARYALTPKNLRSSRRAYVSPDLTLFLSLTNLRGTPYSLNAAAPGSIEETTFFYADRICFRTTRGMRPGPPDAWFRSIDLTQTGAAGGWDVLQTAAMATGAFPLFLAPHSLQRYGSEYIPPHWESVACDDRTSPPHVAPNFPPGFSQPYPTMNVDGGVTNNDPFNLAHDYLASLDPKAPDGHNLQSPLEADRAVINIAPFPTTEPFETQFDIQKSSSVFWALPRLLSALISQSRFFGESLSQIMGGSTFSRFIIAPSDRSVSQAVGRAPGVETPALQCASLSAFGGFFERKFRAHDYALGRRNCQKFLEDNFVLPVENPIMRVALDGMDPSQRDAVVSKFRHPAPGTYAHTADELLAKGLAIPRDQERAGRLWLPIIPLCNKAAAKIPRVARDKMDRRTLDRAVSLIIQRYKSVVILLIGRVPSWFLRSFLRLGQPAIRFLAKGPLRDALIRQLGGDYEP